MGGGREKQLEWCDDVVRSMLPMAPMGPMGAMGAMGAMGHMCVYVGKAVEAFSFITHVGALGAY